MNKRYIPTKALKINDSEYLPFWKLTFINSEDYGEGFEIIGKNGHTIYNDLIDCYWDTLNHVLLLGIVKDIYPNETPYVKDEEVYVEVSHSVYREDIITKIEYLEYDSRVQSVKSCIDNNDIKWYFSKEEQKNLDINAIYEFKIWKPYYVLSDNSVIKWEHQLKHKFKQPVK